MVCNLLHSQTIRYVRPNGIQGQGYAGPHSWKIMESYRDLQAAINDSQPGDEVWVAQGTYVPKTDSAFNYPSNERWCTFVLKEGVKVRGSFQGLPGQEGNLSFQNVQKYTSVLSGDKLGNDPLMIPNWPNIVQANPTWAHDNVYSIIRNITPLTSATLLDNFVIRDAFWFDSTMTGLGSSRVAGAICLRDNASPVLSNLHISYNRGSISNLTGTLPVSIAGSGITVINSAPQIKSCRFYRNYMGAAISINNFFASDSVFIRDSYIIDNYGGDVSAALTVHGSANVNVLNTVVYYNWAHAGAGLFALGYWSSAPVDITMQNCFFVGNYHFSTAYPGRLFYLQALHPAVYVKVANSVLYYNGPKYTSGGTPDGIFFLDTGASLDISNSDVEFGWPYLKSGSGNFDLDPQFVGLPPTDLPPLQFNYDSAFNVYSTSPLINPNLPQLYFNVPHDIAGNPRDNNPDLSSYEFVAAIPVSVPERPASIWNVFPNPITDILYVNAPANAVYHLAIYDMFGKEVYSTSFTGDKASINVANQLPAGFYVLKISDLQQKVVYNQKIIKR